MFWHATFSKWECFLLFSKALHKNTNWSFTKSRRKLNENQHQALYNWELGCWIFKMQHKLHIRIPGLAWNYFLVKFCWKKKVTHYCSSFLNFLLWKKEEKTLQMWLMWFVKYFSMSKYLFLPIKTSVLLSTKNVESGGMG